MIAHDPQEGDFTLRICQVNEHTSMPKGYIGKCFIEVTVKYETYYLHNDGMLSSIMYDPNDPLVTGWFNNPEECVPVAEAFCKKYEEADPGAVTQTWSWKEGKDPPYH